MADNRRVDRRGFLFLVLCTASAADAAPTSLRGKLRAGRPAKVGEVEVSGDADTLGVLADERLDGEDFEVLGEPKDATHFEAEKIHTRSLFVHKGGKRLMVTYWCDVCYIRTYTPGICWCCQKYTDLDLQ